MKRSSKIWIGIGIGGLGLAAFVMFASRPPERFSETVGLLKGLRPEESKKSFEDWGGLPVPSGSTPQPLVFEQERFVVPGDFASISKIAKEELKPRSNGSASYPNNNPKTFLYSFRAKKWGDSIVVNVSPKDATHTYVYVTTNRKPTWFETSANWVSNLFGKNPERPRFRRI